MIIEHIDMAGSKEWDDSTETEDKGHGHEIVLEVTGPALYPGQGLTGDQ